MGCACAELQQRSGRRQGAEREGTGGRQVVGTARLNPRAEGTAPVPGRVGGMRNGEERSNLQSREAFELFKAKVQSCTVSVSIFQTSGTSIRI